MGGPNPASPPNYINSFPQGYGAPAAAAAKPEEWVGQNSGYPKPPDYLSSLDGSNNLQDKYKLNRQESLMPQLNEMLGRGRGAIDKLNSYATGPTGSSPWAQALLTDLGQQKNQALGSAGAQVNAASMSAADNAAARGGLTSGMRASLARNAQNQGVSARQGVTGNYLNSRNQIMGGDADRQLSVLGQIPGMENAQTNIWSQAAQNQQRYDTLVDQENIKNSLAGLGGQNQFNMGKYENQIKQQSGKEMADATANAGKK